MGRDETRRNETRRSYRIPRPFFFYYILLYTSAIPSVRLEEVFAAQVHVQRLCREYVLLYMYQLYGQLGDYANHGFSVRI